MTQTRRIVKKSSEKPKNIPQEAHFSAEFILNSAARAMIYLASVLTFASILSWLILKNLNDIYCFI
jgi:hypothetical protein